MLKSLSRLSIYAALTAPLIVNRYLFFPFITGKALVFRTTVELALIFFIAAVAVGEVSWDDIRTRIRHPLVIALSLFATVSVLTSLTAARPAYAFWSNFERGEGAWQILHYCLFCILIIILFRTQDEWISLLRSQSIITTLVALYAVGQAFHWPSWIIAPEAAISGTLGNPSYLAGFLLFGIFFTLWVMMYEKNQTARAAWALSALFQCSIFFGAKTRASFIAFAIGTIILCILFIRRKKYGFVSYLITIGITASIIISTVFLVTTVKGNAVVDFQPRLWTWGSAIAGVIERPLLGWGFENFPIIFDTYYNPHHYGKESFFDRAHNIFLEYATSGGIILLVSYGVIVYVLYRLLIKKPDDPWRPVFLVLPLVYLINGMALFEILPLYLMLFLFIAFAHAYTQQFSIQQTFPPPSHSIRPSAYIYICAAVLLFGISFYYTIYQPLQKNRLMIAALHVNNKVDEQIFKEHDAALTFASPVGQQEAAQNLFAFTESYLKFLRKTGGLSRVPKDKIKRIMELNEAWYQKTKDGAVGIKSLYLYAGAVIKAAVTTNDTTYITRAEQLIAEGSLRAPTRIEFIQFSMMIAALKKDTEGFNRARALGKKLRPDIPWESIIEEPLSKEN